jgi:hypothetical protein
MIERSKKLYDQFVKNQDGIITSSVTLIDKSKFTLVQQTSSSSCLSLHTDPICSNILNDIMLECIYYFYPGL